MHSLECRIACSPLCLNCEQVTHRLLGSDFGLEAVVSVQACSTLSSLPSSHPLSRELRSAKLALCILDGAVPKGSTGTAELDSEAVVLPWFSQYYSVS